MARKTKIRVSRPGLFGATGGIPVGKEFEVETVPESWLSKVDVVGEQTGETVVTNIDPKNEERLRQFEDAVGRLEPKNFNEDGRPDVRALNEALPKEVNNFSGEERDALWKLHEKSE